MSVASHPLPDSPPVDNFFPTFASSLSLLSPSKNSPPPALLSSCPTPLEFHPPLPPLFVGVGLALGAPSLLKAIFPLVREHSGLPAQSPIPSRSSPMDPAEP